MLFFIKVERSSTLNRLAVDDADMLVQAGARWEDVNAQLKEKGIPYFFPVSE